MALGLAGAALGLAGCGGGTNSAPVKTVKVPAFQLASPVLSASHVLPNKYACNPKIGVPPLKWGAVPASTAGLALVVYFVSSQRGGQLEPQAVVTGLSAKLHTIKAGVLPHGAVIASDSRVICPTKGISASYFIRIYALKTRVKGAKTANVASVLSAIAPATIAAGSLEVHYRRA